VLRQQSVATAAHLVDLFVRVEPGDPPVRVLERDVSEADERDDVPLAVVERPADVTPCDRRVDDRLRPLLLLRVPPSHGPMVCERVFRDDHVFGRIVPSGVTDWNRPVRMGR